MALDPFDVRNAVAAFLTTLERLTTSEKREAAPSPCYLEELRRLVELAREASPLTDPRLWPAVPKDCGDYIEIESLVRKTMVLIKTPPIPAGNYLTENDR